MKTNQNKLNEFMFGKALEIYRLTGIRTDKYFNLSDSVHIAGWTDTDAEMAWSRIVGFVSEHKHEMELGLSGELCPFCIYHNNLCHACLYASRHGQCGSKESDMIPISHGFERIGEHLSTDFYIKLIKEIENENKPNQAS